MSDTPYTYGNLKADTKVSIWPNGAPENLVTAIDRMILQAVNWLQQNIECLKDEHLDVTRQCESYFHCGLTVIDKPDGVIKGLFTVQRSGFCDPVNYDEVSKSEIYEWSRWFMKIVTSPVNAGLRALPGGFTQAGVSTDDANGRALVGKWAKDNTRLLISPWLQSYEDAVVDWSGYKSKWNDLDLVPGSPDYVRAVKLFVQREFARDFERDPGFQQVCGDDLQGNLGRNIVGAIPALIFQCREKTRQRQAQHSSKESDYLWLNYVKPEAIVTVEDSIVLAAIGDYGWATTAESTVASLVKSWEPAHVITSGNNNYPPSDAGSLDSNVGKDWHEFISPYDGIYGADRGVNRFWPSLGNRDLDQTVASPGKPYFDFFSLPSHGDNNERYYDKIFGPLHVFFINSGYNTVGTLVEPDGNDEQSIQAQWILLKAVRSTIKWKIAVTNSPQSSSQPGIAKPQPAWRWGHYGFHAVINAGDSHSYERIQIDGIPHFVNGSGGAGLLSFTGTPVDGSAIRYDANYGALRIIASCSKLLFEFVNIAGQMIDSYEIT